MGLIIIRTVFVFITLLFIMRLMGKRQIGEMQPYELVITLIIADLACIPMADSSIPLFYGLVAILTIFLLHQIVCLLDLTFLPMKNVLSGKPSIVIGKAGVDDTELKKNNLDVSDLIESLRGAGYFSIDAVDYALYEANGSFSALPKKDYEDVQKSLPIIIIDEGKFDLNNVKQTGKDKQYFLSVLQSRNVKNEKSVLIITVDGNGKVYLQERNKKYLTFNLQWEQSLW